MTKSGLCPCDPKSQYNKCCGRYHQGALAESALKLMRARYSAYALGLVDYVIKTTHKDNPNFTADTKEWRKDLQSFSKSTRFDGLTIVNFIDGEETAIVTFTAHLRQGGRDATFTEKSSFAKVGEQWLYKDGVAPSANLLSPEHG